VLSRTTHDPEFVRGSAHVTEHDESVLSGQALVIFSDVA
jgi:hypothetical protein